MQFIEKKHPKAEQGPYAYFRIASPDGFVKLDLNAPQDEPFTGWSIKPHITPCRVCYTVYCIVCVYYLLFSVVSRRY